MAFVLNCDKVKIMTARDDEKLTPAEASRFMELAEQRAANKPLAYIVGKCEFMGLRFEVNAHTLIPRPDTEAVVEAALSVISQTGVKTVLDMCTGCGCIAISLAALCPVKLDVTASDISSEALDTAGRNAAIHGVPVEFVQSDMFSGINPSAYEMIISNPPYIPHDEITALPRSVKDYEPHTALDGGPDGLRFYRAIAEKAANYTVFEIGYNQTEDVRNILERQGFGNIKIIKDLSGHNRVITAQKNG